MLVGEYFGGLNTVSLHRLGFDGGDPSFKSIIDYQSDFSLSSFLAIKYFIYCFSIKQRDRWPKRDEWNIYIYFVAVIYFSLLIKDSYSYFLI